MSLELTKEPTMRSTKAQDRQTVDVYGTLLKERAVIDDIMSEQANEVTKYSFTVLDTRYPYVVVCVGIAQLALVLTTMWSAYILARSELEYD